MVKIRFNRSSEEDISFFEVSCCPKKRRGVEDNSDAWSLFEDCFLLICRKQIKEEDIEGELKTLVWYVASRCRGFHIRFPTNKDPNSRLWHLFSRRSKVS